MILQSPDLQLDVWICPTNVSTPGQVLGEQQICAGCTVQLEADLSEVPLESQDGANLGYGEVVKTDKDRWNIYCKWSQIKNLR